MDGNMICDGMVIFQAGYFEVGLTIVYYDKAHYMGASFLHTMLRHFGKNYLLGDSELLLLHQVSH